MLNISNKYAEWAPPVLRLALGITFFAHGGQKAFGWWNGGGIAEMAGFLGSLGFTPATVWAVALTAVEFLGGILLLLGLFVRLTALSITISQIVAMALIHLPNGFFMSNGGCEYNVALIAQAIALILTGAGALSLDRCFGRKGSPAD